MPKPASQPRSTLAALGLAGVASILWRYFREKAAEQLKSVWFIIAYLLAFQALILQLPIVYSVTIALGIGIVVVGLTFFMEGLRLGLMPFGETIGAILPRNSKLPLIITFAFLLGVGATLAEPAISVLKSAGAGVSPEAAPLLYSLLNDFSGQLVAAVGIGVGVAVTLGILRFFFGWSLKILIIPLVTLLCALTLIAYFHPDLNPIIGLAWDCGAVTTGPVTVPLVLALGIGVCRIIGDDTPGTAGFGIVTLASLFPILAVLCLAFAHLTAQDFYGAANYRGDPAPAAAQLGSPTEVPPINPPSGAAFTEQEFQFYLQDRTLPETRGEAYRTLYQGGDLALEEGRIVLRNAEIVLEKIPPPPSLENFVRRQAKNP